MLQRMKDGFRVAAPPSLGIAVVVGFIFITRWSEFADDPIEGIAIGSGLVLVVFLTYFFLALTGFKASQQGVVEVPRVYAWLILSAIVVSVFVVVAYLLARRS
jgi:hypothetical protein